MFDMDGDGDIDAHDEELFEYDLQIVEDEMMMEEYERRRYEELGHEEYMRQKRIQEEQNEVDWERSCLLGINIAVVFFACSYLYFGVLGW